MSRDYYLGKCCRIWLMILGAPVGRCGICGEKPDFLREAVESDLLVETREW